jgi:transcription elongation factor SPT6
MNRQQFVKNQLLTSKVFLNASAFLRIPQDPKSSSSQARADDDNAQDPLDDTRIHIEDYELARKMAIDALELDEEDTRGAHPSNVVLDLMNNSDAEKELKGLNLDEFAVSLYQQNNLKKRHTLSAIRDELLRPFSEQREPFVVPDAWQILGMLSGENRRTLRQHLIITVQVTRAPKGFVSVRLASGVEGIVVPSEDGLRLTPSQKGAAIQAVIVGTTLNRDDDQYQVELTTSVAEMAAGDRKVGRVDPDLTCWNRNLQQRDEDILARKKRAEANKTRRVIKHPNFHNFNTVQAESYLEDQPAGDVVIRPSSKGFDHLAITWKVDDGLYQHIGNRLLVSV